MKLQYHRETCSRCGGTGHYSYCSAYGTMCFKCNGSGNQISKIGSKTKQFAENLISTTMDKFPNDGKTVFMWQRYKFDKIVPKGHKGSFKIENGKKIKMYSYDLYFRGRSVITCSSLSEKNLQLKDLKRIPTDDEIMQVAEFQNNLIKKGEANLC